VDADGQHRHGETSQPAAVDVRQAPGEPAISSGEQGGAEVAATVGPQRHDQARLVFASFLMLFIELALIRWVTANNVYVTKATNFMLLASFLGIGIGFLNAKAPRGCWRWSDTC
jgi:hypothetical protein